MITIGDGELIGTYSLLIPKNENASIPITVGGTTLELVITFDNSGEGNERSVSFERDNSGNRLKVILHKWDNSLGTALTEPAMLGTLSNGQELRFMMCSYAIGNVNKFDLQLLRQDAAQNT